MACISLQRDKHSTRRLTLCLCVCAVTYIASLLLGSVDAFAQASKATQAYPQTSSDPAVSEVSNGTSSSQESSADIHADDITAKENEPLVNPCGQNRPSDTWFDYTHLVVSESVCYPSLWVDSFFGDPGNDVFEGGTQVRITQTEGYNNVDKSYHDTNFKVDADLPNATRKLRLILESGGQDQLTSTAETPGVPGGALPNAAESKGFQAGLRRIRNLTDNADIDFDIGLRSNIKLFTRARYRYRVLLSDNSSFVFKQEIFWYDERGFGEKTLFEYDRMLNEPLLFRWDIRFQYTEENRDEFGVEWRESQSLTYPISYKAAIIYTLAMQGVTEPSSVIDTYLTSARYRQQFFRPWLYYEVEPYINWPRTRNYDNVAGINLRLEIWFGN